MANAQDNLHDQVIIARREEDKAQPQKKKEGEGKTQLPRTRGAEASRERKVASKI
jgi:hypothetical protein